MKKEEIRKFSIRNLFFPKQNRNRRPIRRYLSSFKLLKLEYSNSEDTKRIDNILCNGLVIPIVSLTSTEIQYSSKWCQNAWSLGCKLKAVCLRVPFSIIFKLESKTKFSMSLFHRQPQFVRC